MIRCDALIVGGGPAGSTAARLLRRAGWSVVVADRARFPRDKVCAGWLTPTVFSLLDLTPEEYRSTGLVLQEITGFRTSVMGGRTIETRYPRAVSYAVRRCEFDTYLLRRAGARVLEDAFVRSLRRQDGRWIVNDAIDTPVVIGAGGHFCPVARHLRREEGEPKPIVAKEAEFRLGEGDAGVLGHTPELFFCRDVRGYAWCVQKGEYLNVGIGRRNNDGFGEYVSELASFLESRGVVSGLSHIRWHGHAYHASGAGPRPLIGPGVLLAGDAAGLAYPESGEGIRPAIESGRLAAQTLIKAAGRHALADLQPYADALTRLHPPARPTAERLRGAVAVLGRLLLSSRSFTRHVVLDRWFLRSVT